MSKIRIQADDILAGFAGTREHDKIRAARLFCNSDSAFLAWAKRATFSLDAIRAARLIQQAWKRFGAARSALITLRAVKAALLKLLAGAGVSGLIRKSEGMDLLLRVTTGRLRGHAAGGHAMRLAVQQSELFA